MEVTGGVLGWLRQPEYTGENRCLPCTAVNLAIAFGASVVVGLLGWRVLSPAVAGAGAIGVFGVSTALIYLRGYLVPGTPALTKRYMPVWALQAFGKAPEPAVPTGGDVDPEEALLAVGALEECPDGPDLCLTGPFRSAWYDAIDAVADDDASRQRLLDLLDVDQATVEIKEYGSAFRAYLGDRPVGTWPSEAAFLADLGGATVLSERWDGWTDVPMADRAHLLNGLRLFIDRCPICGEIPEFGTEEVESCCGSYDVAAVECEECGARLFESGALDGQPVAG